MLRVLIADDHRLILEGVRRALEATDDIEIVAEANSGSEVLPLVARMNPDIAMLDLRMPGMDGLTCLDRIRQRHPDVKVVILSVSTDQELIQTILRRGAAAYIVKSVNPGDLPAALRQVQEGTFFSVAGMPDGEQETVAAKEAGLTERELLILRAVAQGMSNEAIAKQLWIAQQTVKFHLTNIYRKLEVANRTEATHYAYQHGLVAHPVVESA